MNPVFGFRRSSLTRCMVGSSEPSEPNAGCLGEAIQLIRPQPWSASPKPSRGAAAYFVLTAPIIPAAWSTNPFVSRGSAVSDRPCFPPSARQRM